MKMKNFKYIIIFFLFLGGTISCNQNNILEEKPKDFLSPENSFTNRASFESALANIYLTIRTNMYANRDNWSNFDMLGGDVDFAAFRVDNDTWNEYFYWNTINADSEFAEKWWTRLYNWIYQANVIIDRSEENYVIWESDKEKNAIVGEAKFIRAFAYHFLGNMWGGVPLVLHETTSAKFDYTRATQEKVYKQCKEDLEFAVQWMPTIDQQKGGRAPQAAAYHLLSEVDICLQDYDGAIAAAGKVISDPNFNLMAERFGKYKNFTFNGYDYRGPYEPWGDVYFDLFQKGNMNWLEGNHETIWNMEMNADVLGGGNNADGGNFVLERWWGPGYWGIKDINGTGNLLKDTLAGRPVGALSPNAWSPTDYIDSVIWKYKDDFEKDIRNSKYNIQREYYWTNPSSEFYGKRMTMENIGTPSIFKVATVPWFKKSVPVVHQGLFSQDRQGHDGGGIFKDWYIMRLPETLLLRAEAYFRKGNLGSAAADINVVRNRAKATPVVAGDVNLDLILDERARELYMEEFRLNTLMRMGKLTEYLIKYNPAVISKGYNLNDHLNKLPIPNSEIEANSKAKLEQNPGY